MEYFRRFSLWFVSAFGAALGVAVVTYGYLRYFERERQGARDAWLPSTSVEIKDVENLPVAKEVTVAALMTNNASQDVFVDIELTLSQGTRVLYTCTRSASRTPGPGKSLRIQVSCPEVEKQSLPSEVSYSLKVQHVRPVPQ
jgi:hypothetical protein